MAGEQRIGETMDERVEMVVGPGGEWVVGVAAHQLDPEVPQGDGSVVAPVMRGLGGLPEYGVPVAEEGKVFVHDGARALDIANRAETAWEHGADAVIL